MANYLVVTGDNPNQVTIVEDKSSLTEVIDTLELEDGDKATIYRVANVRTVRVRSETVRKVTVE